MTSMFGTRCVLFWFASLLPPESDDDVDYYETLGVARNATKEDIRKAYKKKSLSLHPDKIIQRGGNPDDYRKEYELIQEAHTVLSDDKKRQTYNLVNRSSTRYKFLTDDGALASAYENLAASTCQQKSRLMLLIIIILGILFLQPILICIKINHELQGGTLENLDWILLLIPWWCLCVLYLVLTILITFLMGCTPFSLVKTFESFFWVLGQVVLALRWDQILSQSYYIILIPFYVAIALRWLGYIVTMRQISIDVLHMITIEKLEEELGKPYQDLTEEEQEALANEYIIVHVPPHYSAEDVENDDFVRLSPEYQAAIQIYYQSFSDLFISMLFGIPLLILIVLKLDGKIDKNWWTVFSPAWIYYGVKLLSNCYSCCCASVGEQVVVVSSDTSQNEEQQENEKSGPIKASFVDPNSSFQDFNARMSDAPINVTSNNTAHVNSNNNYTPPVVTTPTQHFESEPQEVLIGESKVEGDLPPMDEEAFHKFQEAFEQAETNASEAQAKAGSNICTAIFQLMLLCLIVGKLDQDVPKDDAVGYNALWILFPCFIFAGIGLCCCACLIYGAGIEGLDTLMEKTAGNTTTNTHQNEKPNVPEPNVSDQPQPLVTAQESITGPSNGVISEGMDDLD
jgi:DnaJ domain/Transmembrane Fragile-X-F protein